MRVMIDEATTRPAQAHENARAAQERWALTPISKRLRIVSELRHLIAGEAETLASTAGAVSERPLAEKLASEVLPLADACRWLERNADRVLATRRFGSRARPLWLRGSSFEVQRQPFGLVLVIGPGNYPLFLPAVHALHALVAGNGVLLKPAPNTRAVATAFALLAMRAGLDPALLTILPESVAAARKSIASGVDKVIFTGSSETGRTLLADLAMSNTPAVMELSGEDAVVVFADADLHQVVRALRFGGRLNAGNTCMVPQRLIVVASIADELVARLSEAGVFAPPIERVEDEAGALSCAHAGTHGLGVSIFSRDLRKAHAFASGVKSGFALINDVIVPTADPRMPFGGVKASGSGVTRGREGLLEMTFAHVVGIRRGRARPHFDEPAAEDARLFASYIRAAHGRGRIAAFRDLLVALFARIRNPNP